MKGCKKNMYLDLVFNYSAIIASNIEFMLAMLIIVLVAACFLGRYIVITKKMVFATFGIAALEIIAIVCLNVYISHASQEIIDAFNNGIYDEESIRVVERVSYITNMLTNIAVFLYAFIFYLIAFKEKRLLRAVESTICLWLYYQYLNTIGMYSYIFVSGGNADTLTKLYAAVDSEGIRLQFVLIMITFSISLLLFLILYFGYYRKKRFYIIRIRDRIIFVIWLFVFSIFPAMPFRGDDIQERYEIISLIFGILIPVIGGVVPILLAMGAAEHSLKERNKYQESYLTAELEYIEQYKKAQTETRAFRHDIINNLSLTNMMLEEGKVDEAKSHLSELLGNVKSLSPQYITGDEMLDCIVAMKASKMKELGIDFTLDGVIDGGLNMKPMSICSIFANALDNAIEAAEKCIEITAIPFVAMEIKRTEKFFVIKISNSSLERIDVDKLFMSSGYTSKKDKEHHGLGLRNIRQSVEEYDGLLKAESLDKEFRISIMVPRSI